MEQGLAILKELIATPNGQVRLVSAAMMLGPGYYIAHSDIEVGIFTYVMVYMGFILMLFSIGMAVYAAKLQQQTEHEERREHRDHFEASKRIMDFTKEVLHTPVTRNDIASMKFSGYEEMTRDQLYVIAMQSTARESVLCGISTCVDGKYHDKDATQDATTYHKGDI